MSQSLAIYSVYHHSPNASVTTCLPVPFSAKMYHGFKCSFVQHRINICVHLVGTGTGRQVVMMHYGNVDVESSVAVYIDAVVD